MSSTVIPATAIKVDLTDEQRGVITCGKGPQLVVAGAGTGKTRVLTQRIIHLIESGQARPEEILAVTFTNKAAREMKDRLETALGEVVERLWVGSFHSVSLEIVKRHARECGYRNERIGILDEAGQAELMIEVLQNLTSPAIFVPRKVATALLRQITVWKEAGLMPDQVDRALLLTPAQRKAHEVYGLYQEALAERNVCDFADLLLNVVVLMRRDKRVRDYWRQKLSFVLVDEMQDVNRLQVEWLFHLTGRGGNLFCVGDTRQAIYEWRNATPDLMNRLHSYFGPVTWHSITQNFRSTHQIVDVANRVAQPLKIKEGSELVAQADGPEPDIRLFDTQDEEIAYIVDTIADRIAAGHPADEIAILTRTGADLVYFEDHFRARGLPFFLVGGGRFKDDPFVLDVISYLRLAGNPFDTTAFMRAANAPERHIRRHMLRLVDKVAVKEGLEITQVIAQMGAFDKSHGLGLTGQEILNMEHLADVVDAVSVALLTGKGSIARAMRAMIEATGYRAWAQFAAGDKGLDALDELVEIAEKTQLSASEFVNRVIAGDIGDPTVRTGVALSTIHAAKGLEYDLVFTPFLVEEKLPHYRALKNDGDPQEERRLAHVAWTRPKKELVITASWLTDLRAAKPSRFLRDIGCDAGFDPAQANP